MTQDKSHFFWHHGEGGAYGDGIPVPRVTYRCKGKTSVTKKAGNAVKQPVTHECKLVTDHPGNHCLCVCGERFNFKNVAQPV